MPRYRYTVRTTDGRDLGQMTYDWYPALGDEIRLDGNKVARVVNVLLTNEDAVPAEGLLEVELL